MNWIVIESDNQKSNQEKSRFSTIIPFTTQTFSSMISNLIFDLMVVNQFHHRPNSCTFNNETFFFKIGSGWLNRRELWKINFEKKTVALSKITLSVTFLNSSRADIWSPHQINCLYAPYHFLWIQHLGQFAIV